MSETAKLPGPDDGWGPADRRPTITVTGFDKLSMPMVPLLFKEMDPKAEVEFAGATKAIVTMKGKELAKITASKYNGFAVGSSRLSCKLHIPSPREAIRIGIGRYTKRRGVADGVSGTTITWIDIAIDSTFLFRRKAWNKLGAVVEEESACGTFCCIPDATDKGAGPWVCLTCKWSNASKLTHCNLCSWEHAYSVRSLPSRYVERATIVLDGKRYAWTQSLNGNWKRTTSNVERPMAVRNLRKFDFEPGNHIGTLEPPSSRLPSPVPANAGAEDKRITTEEGASTGLENDN